MIDKPALAEFSGQTALNTKECGRMVSNMVKESFTLFLLESERVEFGGEATASSKR